MDMHLQTDICKGSGKDLEQTFALAIEWILVTYPKDMNDIYRKIKVQRWMIGQLGKITSARNTSKAKPLKQLITAC